MPKINSFLPLPRPSLQDESKPVNDDSPEVTQTTNIAGTPPFDSTRNLYANHRRLELENKYNTLIVGDDIAKYLSSKEFSQLDPIIQESLRKNLETVKNNPQSAKNFIELAKSGGFRDAGKDLQSAMLSSLSKRPEDKIYREALQEAVGRDDFKKLAQDKQAKVIEDLDKIAGTISYKGDSAIQLTDDDKKFILEKIRKTSVYCGQNPSNDIVRNTLDNIVSGNVRLKLYEKDVIANSNGTGSIEFGYNRLGKDVYINKKANDTDYKEFIDTLSHETNHALNGGNAKLVYITDNFLSEYRAYIVGQKAAGKKVDKASLKAVLDNLVFAEPLLDKNKKPKDSYGEIRQLYRDNQKFKAFVDQLAKDIDNGTIVDGAELRTRLINAGYSSDYIKNTNNTNNK